MLDIFIFKFSIYLLFDRIPTEHDIFKIIFNEDVVSHVHGLGNGAVMIDVVEYLLEIFKKLIVSFEIDFGEVNMLLHRNQAALNHFLKIVFKSRV